MAANALHAVPSAAVESVDWPVSHLPLKQLISSPLNVRQGDAENVDSLARSIQREGLLTALIVVEDGTSFGVVAGERRRQALQLLASEAAVVPYLGVLSPATLIPCQIRAVEDGRVLSINENVERVDMSDLDKILAFAELKREGMSIDAIATRFDLSLLVVRRYLALSEASPSVLAACRTGAIDVATVAAFCSVNDHQRQDEVLECLPTYLSAASRPAHVRRELHREDVSLTDPKFLFIGQDAYMAAGGTLDADLFDGGRYATNPGLVQQLVNDKIKGIRKDLLAKGWGSVELDPNCYHSPAFEPLETDVHGDPSLVPLVAAHDAISARMDDASIWDALSEDERDALQDEFDAAGAALDAQTDALKLAAYTSEQRRRLRVVLGGIDQFGQIQVFPGIIPPEQQAKTAKAASADEPDTDVSGGEETTSARAAAATGPASPSLTGSDATTESADGETPAAENALTTTGDPDDGFVSIARASANRDFTAALQAHLVGNPKLMLAATVADLYSRLMGGFGGLRVGARVQDVSFDAPGGDPRGADACMEQLGLSEVPDDDDALFEYLLACSETRLIQLLAYCVAHGVDATGDSFATKGPRNARSHALDLARRSGFRFAEHWHATPEYLDGVRKARVMEALAPRVDEVTYKRLSKAGKDDLNAQAAPILARTGWVPPVGGGR